MSTKTKTIRVLIVDDEPLARRTIRDLLADDSEIEIIGECGSGLEAVGFINQQSPDLLFLDVQMPGLNGFETLANIETGRLPATIFVTAYDQYALKAFDVHALDYLLKPFTDKRFDEALYKAKSQLELKEINEISRSLLNLLGDRGLNATEPAKVTQKNFLSRFMIKSGGRAFFVNASDVDWISADDYFIKLHVGDKSHLLRMSMNELEEKLNPTMFLRIHRSTIVNFDRIRELRQTPNGEYVVMLKTGTELKLSRSRRARLEHRFRNGPDE
jgi:two-component system, LytTR family, response regulator